MAVCTTTTTIQMGYEELALDHLERNTSFIGYGSAKKARLSIMCTMPPTLAPTSRSKSHKECVAPHRINWKYSGNYSYLRGAHRAVLDSAQLGALVRNNSFEM